MTIPAPQDRAILFLKDTCDVFPGAEKLITNARQQQMRKARYWPPYTFLPRNTWMQIGQQTIIYDPDELWQYLDSLAALGAWQYTKGVYVFDPEIFAALVGKPFEGKLPLDALTSLPEWSMYIDTPGLKWDPLDLAGVFVYLNWNTATGATELSFVPDVWRPVEGIEGKWEPSLECGYDLPLGDWTLKDAIALSDFHVCIPRESERLFKNPHRKLTKTDMDQLKPKMDFYYALAQRTKEQTERIIAYRLETKFNGQTTEEDVRKQFEKEQAQAKEKQCEIDAAFNNGMTLLELARIMQDEEDLMTGAMTNIVPLVSLVLYICTEKPDISSDTPGQHPKNPTPKRVNRQLILEQPACPTVWHVGKTSGEKGKN